MYPLLFSETRPRSRMHRSRSRSSEFKIVPSTRMECWTPPWATSGSLPSSPWRIVPPRPNSPEIINLSQSILRTQAKFTSTQRADGFTISTGMNDTFVYEASGSATPITANLITNGGLASGVILSGKADIPAFRHDLARSTASVTLDFLASASTLVGPDAKLESDFGVAFMALPPRWSRRRCSLRSGFRASTLG